MVDVRRVTIAVTVLCAYHAFAKSLLSTSDEDFDSGGREINKFTIPIGDKPNLLTVVLLKDKNLQPGQHRTSESYNVNAYTMGKPDLKNIVNKKLAPGILNLDDYADIELDDDADIDPDEHTDSSDSNDDSDVLPVEILRKTCKSNKKICKKACKIATISTCERYVCSKSRKKSMAKKCIKKCKKDVD